MEETAAPAAPAPEQKPARRLGPGGRGDLDFGRYGRPAGVGKQKGTPNKVTVLMRDMARSLTLGNEKVLKRLGEECESGKIHPAVFIKLLEYGYGRVKYVVELEAPPESPARTMAEAMRQLSREDQLKLYDITRRMQLPQATVIDVKTSGKGKRVRSKKQAEAPPA